MCTVAAGSADAYYENGIHCWDMAASDLVLREAGGAVMDIQGDVSMWGMQVMCPPGMVLLRLDISGHPTVENINQLCTNTGWLCDHDTFHLRALVEWPLVKGCVQIYILYIVEAVH